MSDIIRAAFDKSAEINSDPNKWSMVEISDRVLVKWGYVKFNGKREKFIQTIVFHGFKDDGTIITSEHTHA